MTNPNANRRISENQIISREDARDAGLKHFFTGQPCKHGHVSVRYVGNGECFSCAAERNKRDEIKAYQKKYREENKDSVKEYHKNRYETKKESLKVARRAYYLRNKERIAKVQQKWYEDNKESYQEYKRKWLAENKDLTNCRAARRRASKRKATPDWLTDSDNRCIRAIYEMSSRLSECLGVKHHVDHIVPLKGKGVCGLHVPWNLRAIPAKWNFIKGNKDDELWIQT